jgi:citrate synthase
VAAATKADVHGCITAALAALAGPLHGGHALAVYRLLEETGSADRVAPVVDARLARGKSFPGFGHPVYRGEDPRTAAMRRAAEAAVADAAGAAPAGGAASRSWLELARAVDTRARAATGKFANVDFYLAPLYHAAGIPPELFTPVFAVARIPGWLAHVLEQQAQEGLIRPRAAYVGPARQEYVSIRRR